MANPSQTAYRSSSSRAGSFSVKKTLLQLGDRNSREKMLIAVVLIVVAGILFSSLIAWVSEYTEERKSVIAVRERDYAELSSVLQRYNSLNARLTKLKASFTESQLNYEQVAQQLDDIFKRIFEGDEADYLLKKQQAQELGTEFEKQPFTLEIKKTSLDQLISLLYEIQHGTVPLFMGNVTINRNTAKTGFKATLSISSINKKSI